MKKFLSVLMCLAMLLCGCCVFASAEEKTISYISLVSGPAKTEYFLGDEFDKTGMKIEVHYSDGSSEILDDGFNITGNMNHKGTRYLQAEYEGFTTQYFSVNVSYDKDDIVTSIIAYLISFFSNAILTFISYF